MTFPDLDSFYAEAETATDKDALVVFLCDLRDFQADLRALASYATKELLARADTKRFVVPDLGEVQIRKQTKRSAWDNESLTRVLVARALDERILNEETGEYESGAEVVARVLSECARPSWRVTPLRERGIDETEFCHVEDDGWGIMLPARGADVSA